MMQYPELGDVLEKRGIYVGTVNGNSMFPMLRNKKDTVIIRSLTGRLRKYDIVLYKKRNMYILHRVVKIMPDVYVICGDNCVNLETDITDEQIIGKLDGFYRGEQQISMKGIAYKLYCRIWVGLYPVRCLMKKNRKKRVL